MTLQEFINVMAFGCVSGATAQKGDVFGDRKDVFSKTYNRLHFLLPRIYCKDGFNISIQVNCADMCASENGLRTFGVNWPLVEWGFPSEEIDAEKYSQDALGQVGGYVETELLEGLMNEHGGIDLETTLHNAVYSNE